MEVNVILSLVCTSWAPFIVRFESNNVLDYSKVGSFEGICVNL